ncbi:AAA family ATPase [Streptomyces sp. NPDC049585]|uniref:AAA family ATPase n=1 Tax=Streptomyces sp. NPDC049585 TaxID=3155154 RepID=UPI00342C9BC8
MLHRLRAQALTFPLTGRRSERAALGAHAAAARAGRGTAVLISGPSGSGKTRFLEEFRAEETARRTTVLHATCTRDTTPYGALRTLLATLDPAHDGEAPPQPAAHPARAALAPGSGAPAHQVLHALHRLVAHLMTDRPLALVLDDAGHCDEASLRGLEYLLRRARRLPLLVVLAHGTGSAPATRTALTELTTRHAAATVRLGPLTDDDTAALVRHAFTAPADPSFAPLLAAAAGGNPRILTRVLRTLHAEGTAPDAAGAHRAEEICTALTAPYVRRVLAGRPAWTRDVATAAAVLGDAAPDHVAALAGVAPALAATALAELCDAGLLTPGALHFTTEATRAAVLATLEPPALTRLRTKAALLLDDAGRPAREVADQVLLLPGPLAPWMAATLREAADRAAGDGAHKAAAGYLHRLLDAEPDDVSVRAELARLRAGFSPTEALPLLEEALTQATCVRTRAVIAAQYGLTCLAVRRGPAATTVLTGTLHALREHLGPQAGPADRELTAHLESVLLLAATAERTTLATARRHAATTPAPHGDTPAQRQQLAMLATLTALDGRHADRAVDQARRALRTPGGAPGGWAPLAAALPLALADETDDALDALEKVLSYAQECGEPRVYAQVLTARALILHRTGALPDAMTDARTATGLVAEEPRCARMSEPVIALATVLADRGEADRAEQLLAGLDARSLKRSVMEHPLHLMARAQARRGLGDHEGALDLLLACGDFLAGSGVGNPVLHPWWLHAVCLLSGMDRTDEARRIAEAAQEPARAWGTARALGLAGLARGATTPGEEGLALLTEAVTTLAGSPARADHARATHLLGKALLAAGDQRGAREHLRTAVALARQCGALALARAARSRLLAAGGRMGKITGSRTDMLTRTERKVAGLAGLGASNREIAEALFVTVRTVEMHLTSAYRKLAVGDRAGLAAVLWPALPGGATPSPARDALRAAR